MKRKTYYLISLVALMILGFSCAPKNDVEEPKLNLSQNELNFDNAAGTQTINVQTNQAKWMASSPMEGQWVELNQNGTNLEVIVQANPDGIARKTVVIVNAGGIAEKVIINQSAADAVLEAMPQELVIPQKGGTMTIDITSNTETWIAELDKEVDWLTISPRYKQGMVNITALPNDTPNEREAKLIAKSGNKVIEVPIKQLALQKYLLPILDPTFTSFDQVIKAETKRGSVMKSYSAPYEFWGSRYPGEAEFLLDASAVDNTLYEFDNNKDTGALIMKTIKLVSFNWTEISSPDFIEFMENEGYVVSNQSAQNVLFINNETKYQASMQLFKDEGAIITFTKIVEQDKSYPTFAELPLKPFITYLDKKGVAEVKAFEEGNGSTLITEEKKGEKTELLLYNVDINKWPNAVARGWFFKDDAAGLVEEAIGFFDNPNLALWKLDKWYLTNEFKELLADAGFNFIRETPNNEYIYNRDSDKLTLYIRAGRFRDVGDGKEVLALNYFTMDFSGNEAKIFNAKEGEFGKIMKELDKKIYDRINKSNRFFK